VPEGIDLPQGVDPMIIDELEIGARLEAVAPADPGEVVNELPDLLAEVEAQTLGPVQRRPEVGHAAHDDGGSPAGAFAGGPELVPARELQPQLVQAVGAEGRDELDRGRVHAVVEVGGPLPRSEVAADVERR